MIYSFLLVSHVVACLLMIFVVLLQTGRGAGLAVFGGGGDSLINTPSGSSFMKKVTAVLAGAEAPVALSADGTLAATARGSATRPDIILWVVRTERRLSTQRSRNRTLCQLSEKQAL